MRAKTLLRLCALLCLMIGTNAFAQEGHPLKGSWIGYWGPNKTNRIQVRLLFEWDGKNITGLLNPGPGSVPIQKATLEPKGWLVHFEVDAKDNTGKSVHYIVDGKIENLSLPNRSIVGTWNHDNVKGDFEIIRQ